MGRPIGMPRMLKTGKCIICGKVIVENHNRVVRKTCSDECYKETRKSSRFIDEEVRSFRDKAGKERRDYLKTHYESPYYNVNRV